MMKSSIFATPAILVAVAFPVLFVLAPDGIPFAYASCGVAAGNVTNYYIALSADCTHGVGSTDNVFINSSSLSAPPSQCRIVATISLTIETGDGNGCSISWNTHCTNNQCYFNTAAGPTGGNYTVSWGVDCDGDQEPMEIKLERNNNCACTTDILFRAVGTCNPTP